MAIRGFPLPDSGGWFLGTIYLEYRNIPYLPYLYIKKIVVKSHRKVIVWGVAGH
jgi:hypothetical protein